MKIGTEQKWEACEPLLPLISDSRRQRIARMPSLQNKLLSLSVELLLRKVAGNQLGVSNEELILTPSASGKPYFKNYENFHFNWSHTKDALLLAVSDSTVGADIEKLPLRGKIDKLSQRFFTKNEASYVMSEASKSNSRFAYIWTRKEAYTKYTESGLTVPLDSFDVLLDPAVTGSLQTFAHEEYMISTCVQEKDYRWYLLSPSSILTEHADDFTSYQCSPSQTPTALSSENDVP